MIPRNIEHSHILRATNLIDSSGIPKRRDSTRYDLLHDGKYYPPKLVISFAVYFAKGQEHPFDYFNAVEAKNYFLSRGFTVFDKKVNRALFSGDTPTDDAESGFPEGKVKYKDHKRYERDSRFTRIVKEQRFQMHGELRCEVCGFSFWETYGDIGSRFIEAHHTIPVARLGGETRTKAADIALVCSNCHRMLHHGNASRTISALKEIVEQNKKNR